LEPSDTLTTRHNLAYWTVCQRDAEPAWQRLPIVAEGAGR
jgi:hypothetical protein